MTRRFVACWVLAVLSSSAMAGGAASGPATRHADANVIIDQRSYVREWIEFGRIRIAPDALQAEGDVLFGRGGKTPNYRRLFGRYVAAKDPKDIDWAGTAWMKDVRVTFFRGQLGDDTRALRNLPEVPAPAGWAKRGFDDAAWRRRRLGVRKPVRDYQENFRDSSDALVRNVWVRTYFDLTDPAACGDLVFQCRYRGGVRVFLNGTEIARGHLPTAEGQAGLPTADRQAGLPAGTLGPEVRARTYPRQAYFAAAGEVPKGKGPACCADLRCAFDEAPPSNRNKGYHRNASNQELNRKGWQRLLALRDRRMGPVPLPARLLRRGSNVLAVEVRGSDGHPCILPGAGHPKAANWADAWNPVWPHARLVGMEVRTKGAPRGVSPAVGAPGKARVWVADLHDRLFSNDANPPGWPVGEVRIVAVPNGTFAAQLAVAAGARTPLAGLQVAPGNLKGPAEAKVPASAWSVLYGVGHPMKDLWTLGYCRSLAGLGEWGQNAPMAWAAIYRQLRGKDRAGGMTGLEFFDHLTPRAPKAIPAGRCQPVWLSLRVPPGTPPGRYTGQVSLRGQGMEAVSVPVVVEVIAWRVPAPREFQTIVQSEQSPYGLVKHYKVRPWSPEHFRLIDSSFRQLARLGADWVFVPVLLDSEFGNRRDAPIRWVRRRDGSGVPSLGFDFAVLDRYLDLAVKHLGTPRVICFNVMHGAMAPSADVKVLDEATGREQVVDLGPKRPPAFRKPYWQAFIRAVTDHMRARGLGGSVHWGQAFDNVYDWELIRWTAAWAPGTAWAAAGHGRNVDKVFRAVARAYGLDLLPRSQMGWRHPAIHLLMPRTAGSIICVEGTSTPFTYRVLCDRAIYAGFNGIGRMGADYFDVAFYDGCRGREYQLVGRSCTVTLWPGAGAVDTGARNEVMLEGIQEAEARIFCEQTLQRSVLPADLARRVQEVLNGHAWQTLYIPASGPSTDLMDFAGDWQGRSRRLYAAAAEVAALVGLDLDRTHVGARRVRTVMHGRASEARHGQLVLPHLGRVKLNLRLRNWTARPRRWKAAADQPWIVPARRSGTAAGHEDFPVVLDGAGLTPGQEVRGTLTVTDLDGGGQVKVTIVATVGKALQWRAGGSALNVPAGGADELAGVLVNHTDRPRRWVFAGSPAWLTCRPGSGELPAGGSATVRLIARPTGRDPAVHKAAATFRLVGADAAESVPLVVYVIPPYRRPGAPPAGEAVMLKDLPKGMLKSHHTMDSPLKWALGDKTAPCLVEKLLGKTPLTIAGRTWRRGLWAVPHHETVYDLKGRGFQAFVADVGVNDGTRASQYHVPGRRVCFEVYVDGALRATSGLMGDRDPARTLMVTGLGAAKEIKLLTRMERLGDSPMNNSYPGYLGYLCNWCDARFIKGLPTRRRQAGK